MEQNIQPNPQSNSSQLKSFSDACHDGSIDILEQLLKNGVDSNGIDKTWNNTPLGIAVDNNQLLVINFLLKNGANINKGTPDNGITPLWIAAFKGYLDIVRILVEQGADINKAQTDDGSTPLYEAAQNGHLDIVRILVEQGADINKARTDIIRSRTVLGFMIERGDLELVKIISTLDEEQQLLLPYSSSLNIGYCLDNLSFGGYFPKNQ